MTIHTKLAFAAACALSFGVTLVILLGEALSLTSFQIQLVHDAAVGAYVAASWTVISVIADHFFVPKAPTHDGRLPDVSKAARDQAYQSQIDSDEGLD